MLGIGTIWTRLGLLQGGGTMNPVFLGAGAMREYAALTGRPNPTPVPVANVGGPGTRDGHWRESVFGDELMTGILSGAVRPISRVTAAALGDMGYAVDLAAADPFVLPSALRLAELGIGGVRHHGDVCVVVGKDPVVLPDAAVRG